MIKSMPFHTVVAYNTLISGKVQSGSSKEMCLGNELNDEKTMYWANRSSQIQKSQDGAGQTKKMIPGLNRIKR